MTRNNKPCRLLTFSVDWEKLYTMNKNALEWFDEIIEPCKQTAYEKAKNYGSSWTWYRSRSLIDRIFSKAKRIRTIQDTGENKVGESIKDEFQAILNYGIMFLIQSKCGFEPAKLSPDEVFNHYEQSLLGCKKLMEKKNHDYGEAWRDMSQVGIVDEIIVKLERVKQLITEKQNPSDNIHDVINYAIFALILIEEGIEN
jgi:hypothetical protein